MVIPSFDVKSKALDSLLPASPAKHRVFAFRQNGKVREAVASRCLTWSCTLCAMLPPAAEERPFEFRESPCHSFAVDHGDPVAKLDMLPSFTHSSLYSTSLIMFSSFFRVRKPGFLVFLAFLSGSCERQQGDSYGSYGASLASLASICSRNRDAFSSQRPHRPGSEARP